MTACDHEKTTIFLIFVPNPKQTLTKALSHQKLDSFFNSDVLEGTDKWCAIRKRSCVFPDDIECLHILLFDYANNQTAQQSQHQTSVPSRPALWSPVLSFNPPEFII